MDGADGYRVISPDDDARRDYPSICDVSGDAALVDGLIGRLRRGGELVLAGFYDRVSFAFPAAFMKEARIRVAAEWQPPDLDTVLSLLRAGKINLDGLITHRSTYQEAQAAYRTAFTDAACLKMLIDWRSCS
jgi:3-hydroxyethyl bacteriochlorophyllide a dehydrogenase